MPRSEQCHAESSPHCALQQSPPLSASLRRRYATRSSAQAPAIELMCFVSCLLVQRCVRMLWLTVCSRPKLRRMTWRWTTTAARLSQRCTSENSLPERGASLLASILDPRLGMFVTRVICADWTSYYRNHELTASSPMKSPTSTSPTQSPGMS